MKVEQKDGSRERRILIGMIVNRTVLARIASKWEDDLFKARWSNLIGEWCVDFYKKYDKAPGKAIEGLFETWASENKDTDTVKLMEKFLDSLSSEYMTLKKECNPDYVIDQAANHFNTVKVSRLAELLQGDIDSGFTDKAVGRIQKYNKLEIGVGSGVNILQDVSAIQAAFEEQLEPLITYPGDLGKFFRGQLQRDAFVSFMGPEKRGKTWWLLDIGWRAMCQRRKVAFFEVGDMSQNQIMRRLMIRASRRPMTPGKFNYPKAIVREAEQEAAVVTQEEKEYTDSMSWQAAMKACQSVMNKTIKSQEPLFKLSCHPNSSINVMGMHSVLQTWEREGWVPDVIVVDYADILAPPLSGAVDSRDQVNTTWKQLRALSQSLHCLVVTATQTDAASYKSNIVDRSNFSEDKRKLAHVTGMVGLNATAEEKEEGIIRLNWVVLRESAFNENQCVHVAGCLPIGNPAVRSTF